MDSDKIYVAYLSRPLTVVGVEVEYIHVEYI